MDPSDSYLQGSDAANRIGWANVNGVTSPNVLQELNVKNTGPQFIPAHASGVVSIEGAFDLIDTEGAQHVEDIPSWLYDEGQPFSSEMFHNLPWAKDVVPLDRLGYMSSLSHMFGIEVQRNSTLMFRTFSHPAPTEKFITMQLTFDGTNAQDAKIFVNFIVKPGSFEVEDLQKLVLYLTGVTQYPLWVGNSIDDMLILTDRQITYAVQ